MSNFLFVTWDGGGNVAPAVLMGKELHRRGETVRFLGQPQQRDALESAGFAFTAYSSDHLWKSTGKRGALTNALGFLGLLVGRSLGRDLVVEFEAEPTDLVVVDCLLYGALEAASRHSIRHAVLVHSLFAAVDQKMAGGAPGAVARLAGFTPRQLWSGADTVLVTTLEELDPGRMATGVHLSYTGPIIPEASPVRSSSKIPSILVSLSTTYISGQTQVLQRILDALADLPVRVIATTGPAVDPKEIRGPNNAEIHGFLPHADIMPTVSLVVGHGGHATTMLALAHDLPLVILPMNLMFDQKLIGDVVCENGAGVTLRSSSSVGEIRAALERMLADGPHRQEAARIGAEIRATRGAEAAADLLQKSIQNNQD